MSSSGRYQRTNAALLLGAIFLAAAAMPWSCQAGFATGYLLPRVAATLLALSLVCLGISLSLASLFLRWKLTGPSLLAGLGFAFVTLWAFGGSFCERCYVAACDAGNGGACVQASHFARDKDVFEDRLQKACAAGWLGPCDFLLRRSSGHKESVCRSLRRIAAGDNALTPSAPWRAEKMLASCVVLEGHPLDPAPERKTESAIR